jgi:SAM-dependent methyltransferase
MVSGIQRALNGSVEKGSEGFSHLEPVVKKIISPKDALYPVYERDNNERHYFVSGLRQLESFDYLLRRHTGKRLADCRSIVDFACHYGRVLRCLRAALPNGKLYACDIDRGAVDFCIKEFDCLPLYGSWNVDDMLITERHDLIFCISLLTHTRKEFFSNAVRLWERMLSPGGLLLFTFLGEEFADKWIGGQLDHYAPAPIDRSVVRERIMEFHESGHTFHGYQTPYSNAEEYGIGFLSKEVVRAELSAHRSLKLCEFIPGSTNNFSQDLAVVLGV